MPYSLNNNINSVQVQHYPELLIENHETIVSSNSSKLWNVRNSWKKANRKKDKSNIKETVNEEKPDNFNVADGEETAASEKAPTNGRKKLGYDFVTEDFEGSTLIRTRCLECECVTERKESFYDIPVPILRDEDSIADEPKRADEIFKRACVTKEKLCDTNKYLCDNCMR